MNVDMYLLRVYIYASWTFIIVRIYREKEKYMRKKIFFFGSLVYRVMRVSEEQKKIGKLFFIGPYDTAICE
jgi:hypothetical protein